MGFTIVELLIVIVVIGVLAAITIVAYTGIQNRASDATVQSDVTNLAKKIQLIHADTGEYPAGGATKASTAASAVGNSLNFPGITYPVSRDSYHATNPNLHYCRGTLNGQSAFRLAARSRSGQSFEYTSMSGMSSLGNVNLWNYTSALLSCEGFDYPVSFSQGYSTGTWSAWTAD